MRESTVQDEQQVNFAQLARRAQALHPAVELEGGAVSALSTSKPSGAIREAHVRTCATSTSRVDVVRDEEGDFVKKLK